MAKYDINYNKWISWVNHPDFNNSDVYQLLKCLVTPIKYLKGRFDNFMSKTAFKLKITGQVVYLERMLNYYYGSEEGRITIGNMEKQGSTYLYDRGQWDQLSDNEKIFLDDRDSGNPVYIYDRKITGKSGGFTINVPFQISQETMYDMRSKLDYYKLTGKQYIINITA